MANSDGTTTEVIAITISLRQTVYDNESRQIGMVDFVDRAAGYFTLGLPPFSDKQRPFAQDKLYIPFRLITNIDARELYLSLSRDELQRDYAQPPERNTMVANENGEQVATTTEPSGYNGLPVVVERVNIGELKKRIAAGDRVFTSELTELGTIKKYDAMTGWMLVEKGILSNKHDLMVPVTLVDDVNRETHEVHLVASQADLQRLQPMEPVDVVFVDARGGESG